MLLLATLASCRREPHSRGAEPDLDGPASYERAVALQRMGRHLASVPFFRRAMRAHEGESRLHLEYAEALYNASIEMDLRCGSARYVVRTSLDRTALAREALLEARRSVELSQTTDDRAYALFMLGRIQSLNGLPGDALESITRARSIAPSVPVLQALDSSLKAGFDEPGQR